MLTIDPQIMQVLAETASQSGKLEALPRGDWQGRRSQVDASSALFTLDIDNPEEIKTRDYGIPVADGTEIILRHYHHATAASEAALLYTHGGGKFACSLETHDSICRYYVAKTGINLFAVDFRLAPEFPFPTSVEDSYDALCWLSENASRLGLDSHRIGIAGDSGGGGFAAGVALMARDRQGPALKKQILVYPMLDDRNVTPDPLVAPYAVWSYDDNYTGWQCFLGEDIGTQRVSPYAAPSRETNLTNLPPAFIDVGDLDIFRDESIDYAQRLSRAGVQTELHVYPGAPHAFDVIAPQARLSQLAWEVRLRAIRDI
jgi:acetyl esterase/lipase